MIAVTDVSGDFCKNNSQKSVWPVLEIS